MENNIFGSFEDYIESIKDIVRNNRKESNELGRSIREIHFHENEVDANFEYFRECYNSNETPEYVVSNLKYNEDELFRKPEHLTDSFILNEVTSRCLTRSVISNADTDDLEDEVEDRWDKTLYKLRDIDIEDAIEILRSKGCYDDYGTPKAVICEALGFSNNFAYTLDDVINEIKKFW
jgi:hypothetical protein